MPRTRNDGLGIATSLVQPNLVVRLPMAEEYIDEVNFFLSEHAECSVFMTCHMHTKKHTCDTIST